MDQAILQSTPSHRERWLALLDKHGVGHVKALHVVEVRGHVRSASSADAAPRPVVSGFGGPQRKSRIEKLSHSTDTSAIRADGPNGFIGSTNKAFCRNS